MFDRINRNAKKFDFSVFDSYICQADSRKDHVTIL